MKQTWSVIKDTLQKKLHSTPSSIVILNNKQLQTLVKLPHVINIGQSLSDQIQSIHFSLDYLPQ